MFLPAPSSALERQKVYFHDKAVLLQSFYFVH